jgi:aminopeptidase N
MLATAIRTASPDQLEGVLAHALTHAWMQSPRAWLSEGVAHFMGTLWIEKQRGRDQALGTLEAARPALALAEPESPGQSLGQPLAEAISPVYYRTKAAYVFWMLRSVAGDPTLSAALRAYDPAADITLGYGRDTAPSPFEKLLEQAGNRRDLSWFFADWINADKGLPDLSIESTFPAPQEAGNWLVTVSIANNGYAAAEIPVTVRSDTNSVTQRVVVPARGKASPRLLILGRPTEVQVNDGAIPETQATVHITKLSQTDHGSSTPPDPTHP